jgi:hypothetical protein
MNSPLYEDGPWLKDPMKPDMFRHTQLGDPTANSTSMFNLPTSGQGGTRRQPEPLPSVASVHQANKPNTQYDEVGVRNKRINTKGK